MVTPASHPPPPPEPPRLPSRRCAADQVLACLVFTSMCVTAMLLGHRSGTPLDRALAALVAAGCMLPCRMLLPRLYKVANAAPDCRTLPWRHGGAGSQGRRPTRKLRSLSSVSVASQAVAPVGHGLTAAALLDRRKRIEAVIKVGHTLFAFG